MISQRGDTLAPAETAETKAGPELGTALLKKLLFPNVVWPMTDLAVSNRFPSNLTMTLSNGLSSTLKP